MITTIDPETEVFEAPEPNSVSIEVSYLPQLIERVDKANRRLSKAGIAERFALVVGPKQVSEEWDEELGRVLYAEYVDVTLNTPALSYNGWTFVATLSFEQGGTVVRTVPGQACSYRPTTKACDQCHTERERNETFVVRNESGEYRQLGRNCLQLFLGVKPSLWVLDDIGLVDFDRAPSSGPSVESVREIVAAALAVTDGGKAYVSRKAEDAGVGTASASETAACLYERKQTGRGAEDRNCQVAGWRAAARTYLSDGTTETVIEIAKAITGSTEYAENVRVLANCEYVDVRNLGIVASFVAVYARELSLAAERKAKATRVNEWVGEVGDKLTTTGTVTNLHDFEGQWGTTELVEWLTADGHTFKWFSSRPVDVEVGDTVTVTGTVKGHDEYKGFKATMLTRCKITETSA